MATSIDIATSRAATALKLLFVADSLAMPVHWYYSVSDIYRQFPDGITKLEAAPAHHPSSIMNLHSTSGGGRWTSSSGKAGPQEVVGEVILKGRAKYWGNRNTHYHHGMVAGENTLNAHCARLLMRTLSSSSSEGQEGKGMYNGNQFLDNYVNFMTADTPLHGDTYAESYHRGYFKNLVAGAPKDKAGAVTHDTASIGSLVTVAPIVLSERLRGVPLEEVTKHCQQHVYFTHPDEGLKSVVADYVSLIDSLLFRNDPSTSAAQEIINTVAKKSARVDFSKIVAKVQQDTDVVGRLYSPACYIDGSWPGVLYFAYRYAGNSKGGLLANANVGGDNVHRGAVLGVLFGLIDGELGKAESQLWGGLKDKSTISEEIQALVA